jgi:hypothetical protein
VARGLVRVQVTPPPTGEDPVVMLHYLARVRQSCCRLFDVRPHRCRVRGRPVGKQDWSWWRLLWRVGALSAKPPSDSGWMNRCASGQLVYVDGCVIPSDLCMNGDNVLLRSMMKARALCGKRSDTGNEQRDAVSTPFAAIAIQRCTLQAGGLATNTEGRSYIEHVHSGRFPRCGGSSAPTAARHPDGCASRRTAHSPQVCVRPAAPLRLLALATTSTSGRGTEGGIWGQHWREACTTVTAKPFASELP